MTEKATNHPHLEWAICSRARNQVCCLKLLRLFDEDPAYWKSKKVSRAAQEMTAIAFSLWRAAFLAEKTGKREAVFKHGRDFLAKIIEDNTISYPQDKTAREWSFNYYTRNARYSLEFLSAHWAPDFPKYIGATRNAVERWDYCQDLLDQGVDMFAAVILERKKQRDLSARMAAARKAKKSKRAIVRKMLLAAR
jgi:hypothetical protein